MCPASFQTSQPNVINAVVTFMLHIIQQKPRASLPKPIRLRAKQYFKNTTSFITFKQIQLASPSYNFAMNAQASCKRVFK